MRGDFSRIRFLRERGYRWVLGLQGRVSVEADGNEQCLIDDHVTRTETVDVIGEYGGPRDAAGFGIAVSGAEILISPGRYYVDGLLCENAADLSFDAQPYLLDAAAGAGDLLTELVHGQGLVVQVYLEAWQRFVTALDDPCLREPALGQVDTTARLQTVWRVVASATKAVTKPGKGPPGLTPCCQAMYLGGGAADSSGTLSARTGGASADCGCEPVPAAGFQGVENQLYRVEVHTGGDETTATFKWSRENASIVSAVTRISGATVQVNSLGPDANLGYQVGQWVELSDDNNLFGQPPNQPGDLYQIQTIQPADPSVTLAGAVTPVNPDQNARLRRWDQSGPSAGPGGIPLAPGSWIPLENGIEICFGTGTYAPGDYWTIPARTATGTIDWPPCGGDGNPFQSPESVRVHRAPIACIHWTPSKLGGRPITGLALGSAVLRRLGHFTVDDCRLLFDPLTVLSEPKQPPALHVQSISWVNDDVTSLDHVLANGLQVTLDQPPTGPVNAANFIVTLEAIELPFRQQRSAEMLAPVAVAGAAGAADPAGAAGAAGTAESLLPATLLRQITIVDSAITVNGQTISWALPYENATALQRMTVEYLNELIRLGAGAGLYARMRVRLLGEMIFADGAAGPLYLDGEAFGTAALRADGKTPRIDLRLPSDGNQPASDFESWFYLAPILGVESLTIDHTPVSVVVDAQNRVIGVTAPVNGKTEKVTPTATLTLSYPPVAAGQLALTITHVSGPTVTLPEIPPTLPFAVGEQTVTFPIKVLANPGSKQTASYTIAATLAGGSPATASVPFQVRGAVRRLG